jgi:hypothetical protein
MPFTRLWADRSGDDVVQKGLMEYSRLTNSPIPSLTLPQINNAFLMINMTSTRLNTLQTLINSMQTTLPAETNAEKTRAMGVEGSLALALSNEVNRATMAESSLSLAFQQSSANASLETQRVRTAQEGLSTALANTQTSLAQATLANTALSGALATLSTNTLALSTALVATQQSVAATAAILSSLPNITALQRQLAAIANCSARGLLAAMDGTCISPAGATSSVAPAGAAPCPGA